jgi:hypothetical protein
MRRLARAAPVNRDDEGCARGGRCSAGDGAGCVGVGLYYERGRRDAFSAIKWYARGCNLASQVACEAFLRVKDAPMPGRPPWRQRSEAEESAQPL